MIEEPVLSVVIPCFNSASYIEETLHSLMRQTFRNFEVVLVDDGSTDNSLQVAAEAMEKFQLKGRVTPRPSHLPKGVSNCRNYGIAIANSKWISFLDSDDLFYPDKILGTVNLIRQHGDDCPAFFHPVRYFEDGTNNTLKVFPSMSSFPEPRFILHELIPDNFIVTSAVTLKKSLADSLGGFDTSLHGIEDYFLWLRVAKSSKWYFDSHTWTDYRVRSSSLMGGRKMNYYVGQNIDLMGAVRKSKEFDPEEITEIDNFLFKQQMFYYASLSLQKHGWGDFLSGLSSLAMSGKLTLSCQLFLKHFKFWMLKKLSAIKKQ